MNTDHLDLWQVHDVRTEEDIAEIFGPDGAIEAFAEAKERGWTRFVGVTGHHDPFILRRCIETYDFDTVLLPVNPAEPTHHSFIDIVMPLTNEKAMGIIGMKVYFRGFAARIPGFESVEPCFRFALSQPISTVVIGCDNTQQVEENVNLARSFQPMSEEEMTALVNRISPYAKQLMYYKP
jgi:predicted aldo/keto reductase-like oxidoreductase